MAMQSVYGIDMGTGTIKIYNGNGDSVSEEKNLIAIRNNESVFAVGNDAYELFERTPEEIEIISPMNNGHINDILMMEAVLHTLLGRTGNSIGYRPSLYFSVPMDMTEIEKRAYSSIAHKGKLKRCRVFLVEKPIADAIALGIPIHHTKGSMIVNIGAESTEMSIISDGHVIISRLVPIGGKQFNEAIVLGVRKRNNFLISRRSAKELKLTLTDLENDKNLGRKVMGIDTVSGLPRDGVISSHTVTEAVREQMAAVAAEIRRFLERTPPQVRAAIQTDGVYLTGGSTQMLGLERFLSRALEIAIHISPYHEMSTVYGLKMIITHPEMQHWAAAPKKTK